MVTGCSSYDERHTSVNIGNWVVGNLQDWDIYSVTNMLVHDTAFNVMGIYNTPGFPSHFKPGRCINHVLQLVIKHCITLDMILFLRENAVMMNFKLEW